MANSKKHDTYEVVISNKQMKKIADYASAVAIKTFERERRRCKKEVIDRRLRNTKMLLRNYRSLVDHCESAISEAAEIYSESPLYEGESIEDIMGTFVYDDEVKIESIKRSKARTKLIITHVQEMLNLYSVHCASSERPEVQRRYDIIYWRYIADNPMSVIDLAEQYNIDTRTVYRDINNAAETLAALFFGIDGLRTAD